jgi:hypothetical protein
MTASEVTPTPNSTLLITDFRDLYRNSLGFDQGGILEIYSKINNNGGALISSKTRDFWYSRLVREGSSFSLFKRYLVLRFLGRGFVSNKGGFTAFVTSSINGIEEYFPVNSWIPFSGTDMEIAEVKISNLNLVDPSQISLVGFTNVYPINTALQIISVTLDYKSIVEKALIQSTVLFGNVTTTIYASGNDLSIDSLIIYSGIAIGGLLVGIGIFYVLYERNRRRKGQMIPVASRSKQCMV